MNITYIARRSLYADHVAGDEYTLSIDTTIRQASRHAERQQQRSLSGVIETLWYYGERNWSVQFAPVQGDDLLALQEFLDSTESGDAFTMTLLGESQPPIRCKRTDDGYTLMKYMDVGNLSTDWFQTGIEVVEQ